MKTLEVPFSEIEVEQKRASMLGATISIKLNGKVVFRFPDVESKKRFINEK